MQNSKSKCTSKPPKQSSSKVNHHETFIGHTEISKSSEKLYMGIQSFEKINYRIRLKIQIFLN